MHGGFWQFGVLVVATSHQPPPPAAVDFYQPHPALLEPNFLVLWLSGWLLAGWLPPCPSLSLSLAADVSGSRQQEVIRSIPCVRRMTRHEGTLGAARRAALRRRVLRATVILN